MYLFTSFRWLIISTLVLLVLGSGTYSPALAQNKSKARGATTQLRGTGGLAVIGSGQGCPNTPITLTATGSCDYFIWEADGATVVPVSETASKSVVTVSWPAPGTYYVTVESGCTNPNSVVKTITIVDTTPGLITTSGTASQVTSTSATICQGKTLQLVPPSNSTAWAWSGANVTTVSSSGVATIQPTAEHNTYSLSYRPSGSLCTVTSTFVVNVAAPPSEVVVLNNEPYGTSWRYGAGNVTLEVKDPNPNYIYNWYDSQSTTPVATGPQWVANVTQTTGFSVSATACQEGPRTGVSIMVRRVQLLVNGTVPTGPVRLTPGVPTVLEATNAAGDPLTWFLNGLQISNQTGYTLSVTQSGRYTARVRYPNDMSLENESQPVDVIDPFDNQTANGQTLTYYSDTQVLQAGVLTAEQVAQLPTANRTQSITYLTGWGQPLQQLAVQAGPNQEDVVQHFAYDGESTTASAYLPFAINSLVKTPGLYETNPLTKLTAYYASVDSRPYATTTTEASPLNRPVAQTQSGTTWVSHPNQISYSTNTAQDAVHLWRGLDGSSLYAAGQLIKEVTVDADGRRTERYKDGADRVILQRKITGYGGGSAQNFDTYSVYAPAGYLQYTVPPEAVRALIASNNWVVSNMPTTFADQWLYQYTYDDRGRLVERKFPGAAPVYLVYDQADRPILVQDGNRRAASQWLFTKYDAQNRPVVSGLYYYNNSSTTARQDLQNLADAATWSAEFESRTTNGYTTSNTFPAVQDGVSGAVVLSVAFFDDYNLDQDANQTPDYNYANQGLSVGTEPVPSGLVRGLPTVTRTRVVQPGGQYGAWLTLVKFYDEYGNLIQTQGNNLVQGDASLGDVTTLAYREQGFVAQVLRSIQTRQTGSRLPVIVRNRFAYDATGRLLQTWQQHQMPGQQWEPEVLVARNRYTGLGELTQKQLHSRDAVKFLQTEDFAYNLHGQLTRINQSDLTTNPENDLFGLELVRETVASGLNNTPRYDGGISAVKWMAHNAAQQNQPERERSYRFIYDGLGRMTEAAYAARASAFSSWNLEVGAYDEKVGNYDANGNMQGLQRYTQASANTARVQIDYLTHYYEGNRPTWVDDYAYNNRGFADVIEGQEYVYDANGSITEDKNKGVTYTYNALNKVEQQATATGSIRYSYDATGAVIKREVTTAGTTTTEYYLGGFVYEASPTFTGIRSVPMPEGRALAVQAGAAQLTYEYHLRDHLGNLRVAFRSQAGTEDLVLTMEPNANEEGKYPKFERVTATRSTDYAYNNPGSSNSVASAAVTSATPGPSNEVPVSHGDKVSLSVYYRTPWGTQYAPIVIAQPRLAASRVHPLELVGPALATAPGRSLEGAPRRNVAPGISLSVTGLLKALRRTPTAPTAAKVDPPSIQHAYIDWKLLNSNKQVIASGRKLATDYTTTDWHTMSIDLDIDLSAEDKRTGYLLVQLRNDGANPVYFDDFTIRHPQDQALVSQENHYYPLGMALSGVAVNTVPVTSLSKEQFNEGSLLQDELLGAEAGVYSTFYRTYDPVLGRFNGVDPLADVTTDWSPYQFAMGNPIAANDPTGALTQGELAWILDFLSSLDEDVNWNATTGMVTTGGGSIFNLEVHEALLASTMVDTNYNVIGIPSGEYWVSLTSAGISDAHNFLQNFWENGIFSSSQERDDFANQTGNEANGILNALGSMGDIADLSVATSVVQVARPATLGLFRTGSSVAKAVGNVGLVLTAANVVFDVATGTHNTHTWVDAGVAVAIVGVGVLAGTAGAPVVAAVALGYGLWSATVGDDLIDENWGYRK
jgi:RHS repeat-associated protein